MGQRYQRTAIGSAISLTLPFVSEQVQSDEIADRPALADIDVLDGFCAYLRRQLDGSVPVALIGLGESIRTAPSGPGVVVVAGERSTLGEMIFRRRTGLRRQWTGTAHVHPGSPGLPFSVWDRWPVTPAGRPPDRFDVLAVMTTFNEADIIEQQLERLLAVGVRVHVIDNWSTDGTENLVDRFLPTGRVTLERFPTEGPTPYFELESLLSRVGEVAHTSGADWVVHHDTDEIHDSPWPDITLRQGLWVADFYGFNCIDHTGIEFRPVTEAWRPGDDLDTSFEYFEFASSHAHFTLLKAWKPQASMVTNAQTGGHRADFEGRRIFPYKFPIRHYSLRSSEHARRKLFVERKPRYAPEERAKGWHTHYDHYDENTVFLWNREQLQRWEDIDRDLLLQKLSGVGLPNNPRAEEALGPVTTPPPV